MPSLTVASTTVVLPDDLLWPDEHQWSPVRQTATPTLTGALVVEAGALQAGREITLQGAEGHAWMDGTTVAQLRAWAAQPGLVLTLNLRGSARSVMFRHQDAPALECRSIVDYSEPVPEDWYAVTLKFMEI